MADRSVVKTVPSVQSDRGKGSKTRERLMDLAYERILEKGFAGTSIEELVEAAGITKSGFFYHFRDKNDLARQLLERYLAENDGVLGELEARARELSEDPLHAFLIFLKLYAEMASELMALHPGCLVATLTYQDRLFDDETVRLTRQGVLDWRARFLRWVEEIAAKYPPRFEIDLVDLADQMSVVMDGSITLHRAIGDAGLIERQALLHRAMIRGIFLPD